MSVNSIYIFGAGGLGKVICDSLEALKINSEIIFVDDSIEKEIWYGKPIVSPSEIKGNSKLILAIGNNKIRFEIYHRCKGAQLMTVIDPLTRVSPSSKIGTGSVILNHCSIQADATVGKCCLINAGTSIDHDAKIGDFVHLRHNVVVSASATIGDHCFIGEKSIIGRGVNISSRTRVEPNTVILSE